MDTMNQVITDNIWRRVKQLARKSGHTTAAIAYVSTRKYVSFGDGDVLVCDASDQAIRSGETSATVLAHFFKAGANIYSCRGLHAKTLVMGRIVLIGSCNLSESSAKVLRELAVVSSDASLRSQALAFVHGLTEQSAPVDKTFIERITRIPVSRRRRINRRKRKTFHFGTRTWVVNTVPLDPERYADEESLVEQAEKAVKKKIRKSRADISWIRTTGKGRFRSLAQEGDTIIDLSSTGKHVTVSPPVAVLQKQDHGHWTRFYYESPDDSISWTAFAKALGSNLQISIDNYFKLNRIQVWRDN
jgi:uncharacterized protein YdhG (YjbR/CyaY superfamily)